MSVLVTLHRWRGRSYRERIRALGKSVFTPQVYLIQRMLHRGFFLYLTVEETFAFAPPSRL